MLKGFCIAAIRIEDKGNAKLRRCLQPGIYLLNDYVRKTIDGKSVELNPESHTPKGLYPDNIHVSAIVGENGSGKSSLLDIMYRVINNFSWIVFAYKERTAADELYFIPDLYATVFFIKDGALGEVSSRGDRIDFRCDNGIEPFSINYDQSFTEKSIDRIQEIVRSFCYSIVTNYSIQAFNGLDYADDNAHWAVHAGGTTIDSAAVWIDSLFHKNDGYMVPIVLNPYRHNSALDMAKEANLTKSRMSALLCANISLLEDYKLDDIEYRFDPSRLLSKFELEKTDLKDRIATLNPDDLCFHFHRLIETRDSLAHIVLASYRAGARGYALDVDLAMACIYLVYKTLLIASRYPTYEDYRHLGTINDTFKEHVSPEERRDLQHLVQKVIRDKSHVTFKITQVRNYISWRKQKAPKNFNFMQYHLSEYAPETLRVARQTGNVSEITRALPPSIFDFDIYLRKRNAASGIKMGELSSGERQLMYNLSTISYHVMNLDSVRSRGRIRYYNVNLVLDEVELCFHPELQRQFISKLVTQLQGLRLSRKWNFNIMLATHSPFILSDIPKTCVLYMKGGHSEEVGMNPFGGNICDTLRNSFFLHNGFHGDYVKSMINELTEYLSNNDNFQGNCKWNRQTAKIFINAIGDEMIRSQLLALYGEKFNSNSYIRFLEEELRRARAQQLNGNEEDMA